jgi:hypothetical protein
MADSKISALPASTTPLAGTEVLPIVQSSTTKQVSVANLTAGRAVSASTLTASTGDITATAGNFVPSTAAKGMNFTANTPAAGMTSQLLNWYEEGTWTYDFTSTTGTITKSSTFPSGLYTRVGRVVTVTGFLAVTSVSAPTGVLTVTGLPYAVTSASSRAGFAGGGVFGNLLAVGSVSPLMLSATSGNTSFTISKFVAGSSADLAGDVVADSRFYVSFTYFV